MTPIQRSISHLLLLVAVVAGLERRAAAQEESPEEPAAASVRELPPLHLINKDGELVPVLKELTFEEWEALIRARLELTNPDVPPRYTIEQMQISGELLEGQVRCTIDLNVNLTPESWVRIPLRMPSAILREQLVAEDGDQSFLNFSETEGYVLWMKVPQASRSAEPEEGGTEDDTTSKTDTNPPPRVKRSVRLSMILPVTVRGGESRLAVDLPRGAVRSELSLLVDRQIQLVAPPSKITREKQSKDKDRVSIPAIVGEFQLSWILPVTETTAPQLDVRSLVLSTISGPRTLRSKARLRVRNLSGPLTSFSILLPPQMDLEKVPADAGFVIEEIQDESPTNPERKTVTVRLDQPSMEEAEIVVVGLATRSEREQFALFDLTGFEVLGAKLQSGHHAIGVEGNWYLHWTPDSNAVRQVDILREDLEAELASWKPKEIVARFRQVSFPGPIRVRVTPERTVIQSAPEHRVFVEQESISLESRIRLRVRGKKTELLMIDLRGWQAAEVGPADIVRLEAVVETNGVLTVPLVQPVGGDLELTLNATKKAQTASDHVTFDLPRLRIVEPLREELISAPAVLAVLADDNVAIVPATDQTKGLVPSSSTNIDDLPRRELPPLIYRQQSADAGVTFVARRIFQPQSVSVNASTTIEADPRGYRIQSSFRYTVLHEPIEWVEFSIPPEVESAGVAAVDFALEQQKLEPILEVDEEGRTRALLIFPEPQMGRFDLRVVYDWQSAKINSRIGLVIPLSEHSFASESIKLTLAGSELNAFDQKLPWKRVETLTTEPGKNEREYRSDQIVDFVPVRKLKTLDDAETYTIVRLAWLQTWISSQQRRDRVVFQVSTNQPSVSVSMPPAADLRGMEVSVNNQLLTLESGDVKPMSRSVDIPVPVGNTEESVVVEIVYEAISDQPTTLLQGVRKSFGIPTIDKATPERTYWQLVLPSDEYLWMEPSGMTSELARFLPWDTPTPSPATRQRLIEKWSGATEIPPPAAGANVYLFSGFGPTSEIEVGILHRRSIVLLGAGLALLIALPLIYVPALRGWKPIVVAGCIVVVSGLAFPYASILFGYGVVAACLLSLIGRLLQITLSRRRQAPRIIARRRKSGDVALDGDAESHATTATAPAIFAPSFGEREASP